MALAQTQTGRHRRLGLANGLGSKAVWNRSNRRQDELPHLNETIDRFLSKALTCNLPITFVNHPAAPHAFDLLHNSETSHEIIRQILAFMQFHLLA